MKTLSEVLQDADPLRHERPSAPHERQMRKAAMIAALAAAPPARAGGLSRRALLAAAALVVAAAGAAFFAWPRASVDVVAAVRFEARIAGTTQAVVRNSDIAKAAVVAGATPGTFDIDITFKPAAAAKLRDLTARSIGRKLELLIDGKVVMAPVIRSATPDASGTSRITGRYTRAEADRIVAGIVGN